MKRTILSVVMMLAIFGLGMLVGGLKSQSVGTTVGVAAPAPAAMAVPIPQHRCPAIHEAIRALESARHDLEEARHDFCGHKREAMEATHRAIEQLREAEGCDKCR
ncbi:MAG: hypothetical protein ABSF45_10855 [Terriglobia bacterium]